MDGAARNSRWRVFLYSFAVLVVPMILWALASPLGSVPDEPSHAIRAAAVVRGEVSAGPWKENTTMGRADVPRYVANMHDRTCYVFRSKVTPACETPLRGDPKQLVTTGSSAAVNSPVYYAIVGIPTLVLNGDAALYGMRMVNVLLCAAVLALMIMQLATLERSRWAVVGALVAITPMVLFLSGSINPNAVEAASAGALFAALVALLRAPGSERMLWERAAIVIVSVGLLVNTRSISLLWLLLVVAAALVFASKSVLVGLIRRPAVWVLLAGSALISIAALLWYSNPPPSGDQSSAAVVSAGTAFIAMVSRTFDYAHEYVGIFGWLDSPAPPFTFIVWSAAIVASIVGGLIWGSGRARWVAVGFGVAMLIVPPVTQAIIAPQLGYIWQGRYMLAIFLCFLVACGMAIDATFEDRALSARLRVTIGVGLALLSIGHIWSFGWTLHRYVVGSAGAIRDMFVHPLWQPPLGWIALCLLLALWTAGASVIVYRRIIAVHSADPVAVMTRIDESRRAHL